MKKREKKQIGFSVEEYNNIERILERNNFENKLLKKRFENQEIPEKMKRVKTQEEKDEEKRRKEERKKANQQRKEEAKQRIEEKKRKEEEQRNKIKEEERQKFLDSLAFDVRQPIEIDPIYDNKSTTFKKEKSRYDIIVEDIRKKIRLLNKETQYIKMNAAQDAVQERQIKMLQAIDRIKKQEQTICEEEQEL